MQNESMMSHINSGGSSQQEKCSKSCSAFCQALDRLQCPRQAVFSAKMTTRLAVPRLRVLVAILIAAQAGSSTVHGGFLEADASDAARRSSGRHVLQAPAPGSTLDNGTFEPIKPAYYIGKQQAINQALRLNQTFFANINQSAVAPIQKITNGTFQIKPVVAAGGSRIESANTDGKRVTACVPVRRLISVLML